MLRFGFCVLLITTAIALPAAALAAAPLTRHDYTGNKYISLSVGKAGVITYHVHRSALPAHCDPGKKYANQQAFAAHEGGKFGFAETDTTLNVTILGVFVSHTKATGSFEIVDNGLGKSGCKRVYSKFVLTTK